MTALYPIGYATSLVPMSVLRSKHEPKMHPEFARRLFPWLESMGGQIGIGGGWRDTQPTKPGFAPDGMSFHQSQTFASGIVGYAAVDLVARSGLVSNHRAPTWAESATAPRWGLHTFIKDPPEPWHMQPVEMRGWSTWVNAGRPDPVAGFPLPGQPVPPPPSGGFVHQTIRLGDVNADVYGAQSVCRSRANQACAVDGVFDAATDKAIRNIQTVAGLVVDGICGPKTWAVLDMLANK